jgi:autotransporter-associated beta strand protein
MVLPTNPNRFDPSRDRFHKVVFLFWTVMVFLGAAHSQAQTWSSSPTSGNWYTASNWDPNSIPSAQSSTATFGSSNITDVSLSLGVSIGAIQFNSGASTFTINVGSNVLAFYGAGIVNNSSAVQNFQIVSVGSVTAGLNFYNSSSAGNSNITNEYGNSFSFNNYSTAGNSNITNSGGFLLFTDNSSAGNANINNADNYGSGIPVVASLVFRGDSSAGNANIINNGILYFTGNSTAGSATITTNASVSLGFSADASGGTARFIMNEGYLDISYETAGMPVTIGSIEGAGSVSLGGNNLTTGANNLSTSLWGLIADGGGNGGVGGSLTKIGTGTFALSGDNSYTGGTNIEGGVLIAENSSALGLGSVTVNGGALALAGPLAVNVGGNYSQSSTGGLQLGLGGTTAGQWDSLSIAGTAALAGNLTLSLYSGYQVRGDQTFDLLDAAGGVNSQFGSVTDLLYEPVSMVYTPDSVILNTLTFTQLGLTTNEKAVGGALDNLSANLEDLPLLNLLDAEPLSSLPGIYDQLSPASLTPIYKMRFLNSQVQGQLVWQRLSGLWGEKGFDTVNSSPVGESAAGVGDAITASETQMDQNVQPGHWGAFINAMDNTGTITSDGNGVGYQFATRGMMAGADYRFDKGWVGGLLIGYDQSNTSQSTGQVSTTGSQGGLYAGWKQNQFHIEVLVDGGVDNYTTQRTAFDGTAVGSATGLEYTGQLNLGYDWSVGDNKINTFVSGQYTEVDLNGFSESGSLEPLTFPNQGEVYLSSDAGVQLSRSWKVGRVTLSPAVSASWEHVYQGNMDSLAANLGTGENFTVYGPATGTDGMALSGGLNIELPRNISVYAQYQGELGMTNYTEQSFTGGINLAFGGSDTENGSRHTIDNSKAEEPVGPMTTPSTGISPVENQAPAATVTPGVEGVDSPVMLPSSAVSPVPNQGTFLNEPPAAGAPTPVILPSTVVSPAPTQETVPGGNPKIAVPDIP